MFNTDNGAGAGGEDERRQHSAEDPSHRTADEPARIADEPARTARDRHAVRFSRRHRRQHSRWPLYAAGIAFALLLLLWWFAGR
jgi:hypothetical protein